MPPSMTNWEGSVFINKKQLVNLKTKAMRSGAWFKALQRIDRVLFDLTIRVVDNIRSSTLAKSIQLLVRTTGRQYGKQFFRAA